MYFELLRRFNGNIPLLDPVEDMEIEDKLLTKLIPQFCSENSTSWYRNWN